MAISIKERRTKERDRKAVQRAQAKAEGKPPIGHVRAALAEAINFVALGVNIGADGRAMIDAGEVVLTARPILTRRLGYDDEQSRLAVTRAMRPRREHRLVGHYPTRAVSPSGMGMPVTGRAGE